MRLAAGFTLLLGLTTTAASVADDTLTVVTLNLWHDQRDWPRRMARIVDELRRVRPDVICLQEVLQHPQLRNQAETLADSLDCHMQFASVDGPERPKRYGNAILTPHRLLLTGARNLEPVDDYRVVAHVRFEWRGRSVDAYSTHLHHTLEGGEIRAKQIRHLLAYVDSTRGPGPLVLAGDFNAELAAPEMSSVTERYEDAFKALHPKASREESATFNQHFGPDPGAIDHIFVARGKASPRPVRCELMFRDVGSDSVWASDHFGVVARLRMAK